MTPRDALSLGGREARSERLAVVAAEPVGPYTLLRLERGALEPGTPGQFFMLEAPGRVLPRPMSLCQAPSGRARLPRRPDRPGDACAVRPPARARRSTCSARSATASTSTSSGRCSSLAGSGSRRCRTCAQALGDPPAILGFRSERHAEAARLLPGAAVVVEPRLVTELLPDEPHDVLACGPEPMLEAVRALAPRAQLAWEAPMACGYGACYGCVVERDGHYVRLCVDGPVLRDAA